MSNEKIIQIKNTSHSFCLAKWYQVTIDLSRGYTHSCHHPARHKVPLEELNLDAAALHNTKYKMLQRKMMLNGERPKECDYCWKIEDSSNNSISDRFIKSTDEWAFPYLKSTLELPWNQSVSPTYLEVMFSSECNLNCAYCIGDVSSSIEKEMNNFGPYPVSSSYHRMPTEPEIKTENPYRMAFWKWLPTIIENLQIFRITGGEPLLSSQTSQALDFIKLTPCPNLELAINTNLSYSTSHFKKFLVQVQDLLENKSIKKFTLFTSLDCFGDQATYIRHGLNINLFLENFSILATVLPQSEIVVMCTYNILSISTFRPLLEWVISQKKLNYKVTLDISYLKDPLYLRANLATQELKQLMSDDLKFMNTNIYFTKYEVNKFERIVDWVHTQESLDDLLLYRSDFYSFIHEFDRRHKLNFIETFPLYQTFLNTCAKANIWLKKN